jgi:hypothetical protein
VLYFVRLSETERKYVSIRTTLYDRDK